MSGNARHLAGISRDGLATGNFLPIDRVNDNRSRRLVKGNSRVTEECILQFVHRDVTIIAPKFDQFVLCQPRGLTQGHRFAIVTAQYISQISVIDQAVVVLVHRTCRSINSHGSAIIIGDRRYANIIFHTIKGHDITSCKNP